MSAFLNLTSNSILMKTDSLEGELDISGAIVKRQGKRVSGEDDDVEDDCDETERKKKDTKKSKVPLLTPADAPKDTAEKFEYILRKGIEDAKRQNPGKVVVVLVDGGGPHTTEPYVSLRPNKMTAADIEMEVRAAGLWSWTKKAPPSAAQAKRVYTDSPIPRKQWTNAELIALELGAVVVYIPLNHPHLNVIEQVWRGVKQHYRLHCAKKNLKNMLECAKAALTGGVGAENVCFVEAIKRRKMRTRLISQHLAANPEADPLSENKLRGKKFKPSPAVDVSQVPKFRSLKVGSILLDLQLYAHHLNQARLKQFRRGVVSECCVLALFSCFFFNHLFPVYGLGQGAGF
jgi:hypothetical protein